MYQTKELARVLTVSKLRIASIPIFLFVFGVAVFRLPYHFSVPPSVSASYVFQFNNKVAVLMFLFGAAGFAILYRGLGLRFSERDSRVSAVWGLVVSCLALLAGVFCWWLSSPAGLEGEKVYFYGRLAQLAAGKTIYREFEFAYGPLLLYLPYWTGKLCHLNLINGYMAFWLLCWAIGMWLLYVVVNAIDIPSRFRTAIYLIFAVDQAQSLWPQGINYTPVRALISAASGVLVYRALQRKRPMLVVVGAAIFGAAITTGVSPEHGIAFMLGTAVFLIFFVRERAQRYWAWIAVAIIAFAAIVVFAISIGEYTTLRSFASGGYNYPIVPYQGVLCVMVLFLVSGCVAYRLIQEHQTESLALYLLCICVFSLPSGFGRADSGHMQLGAISALIVASLALSRYPWISAVAAAVFVYWPGTAQYHSDLQIVRERVEARMFAPSARSGEMYRAAVALLHVFHADAHRELIEYKVAHAVPPGGVQPSVPAEGIVDAPLGLTSHGFADTSGHVDYGYFAGPENVILPSQIEMIKRWMSSRPDRELILPPRWMGICTTFREAEAPEFRTWFGIHWADPKRSDSIFAPLCTFIFQNYVPDRSYPRDLWSFWHPRQHTKPAY